jgi:hypothetical protein
MKQKKKLVKNVVVFVIMTINVGLIYCLISSAEELPKELEKEIYFKTEQLLTHISDENWESSYSLMSKAYKSENSLNDLIDYCRSMEIDSNEVEWRDIKALAKVSNYSASLFGLLNNSSQEEIPIGIVLAFDNQSQRNANRDWAEADLLISGIIRFDQELINSGDRFLRLIKKNSFEKAYNYTYLNRSPFRHYTKDEFRNYFSFFQENEFINWEYYYERDGNYVINHYLSGNFGNDKKVNLKFSITFSKDIWISNFEIIN